MKAVHRGEGCEELDDLGSRFTPRSLRVTIMDVQEYKKFNTECQNFWMVELIFLEIVLKLLTSRKKQGMFCRKSAEGGLYPGENVAIRARGALARPPGEGSGVRWIVRERRTMRHGTGI